MSDQKPEKKVMRICCKCKLAFIGVIKDYYCPECYKATEAMAESMNSFYRRGNKID